MTLPAIQIHGAGAAGWLVAATLALKAGTGAHVAVMPATGDRHGLGPFGPALHLLPQCLSLPLFRALLRGGFLPADALTPSLGIGFAGWGAGGAPGFLPWGETGAPLGGVAFHQLATRLRHSGQALRLSDWSLATMAARENRLAAPDGDDHSPLSTIDWSATVHADDLAAALREMALLLGVRECAVPDPALRVHCNGAPTPDGWESWAGLLPVDHVRFSLVPGNTPHFSLHIAEPGGWRANTPLSGALQRCELHASAAGTPPPDAVHFESGALDEPWRDQDIAIGASACLIEPLLGTALLEAARSAERLAGLLPDGDVAPCAREYNRQTRQALDCLRDSVAAIWSTNGRAEPIWQAARMREWPETLVRKLACYRSRGDVPMADGELFEADDWAMLLDAQGVYPRRYSPLASALPLAEISTHFERLRTYLRSAVAALPPVQR